MVIGAMIDVPLILYVLFALVGVFALAVVLTVNKKTRIVGAVLLSLMLGGGVLVVLAAGWLYTARVQAEKKSDQVNFLQEAQAQQAHQEAIRRATAAERTARNFIPVETAKPADGSTEPSIADVTAKPEAEEAKPGEDPSGEAKPGEKPLEPKPAPAKPDWVGMKPQVVGGVYQMCVTVGPYSTAAECLQEMPAALRRAFDEYVGICLGAEWTGRIDLPGELRTDRVIKQRWDETVQTSFGPMVQSRLLVEFDRKLKDRIHQEQSRVIIAGRLWRCAAILGGVLALLGVAYVGLRVDLETAGRYRGRIVIAVAVAAAAAVALCTA